MLFSAKVLAGSASRPLIAERDLLRAFVGTGGGSAANILRALGVRLEDLDPGADQSDSSARRIASDS
jgi:hypothetical protein